MSEERIELEIFDLSHKGRGIGKHDGIIVFVSGGVIPGDKVTARPVKKKKRHIEAESLWIDVPSPYRCESFCPYSEGEKKCGGCTLASMEYEAQIGLKEKQVKDKLSRIGGVDPQKVRDIIPMEDPFAYRNKAVMAVDGDSVGFRSAGSHTVVDCEGCSIQTPAANAVLLTLKEFLTSAQGKATLGAGEKGLSDILQSVTVRTSLATGEVMVILKTTGETVDVEPLVYMLDDAVYESGYSLESVITDDGKEVRAVAGKLTINDMIGDMKLELSPRSFYQVNPVMTKVLYDKVKEYADLKGGENILDLYCGGGSIGLYLAGEGGYVVGVESVRDAVIDANRNAVINGIINARFICGKAEDVLPELINGGSGDEVLHRTACDSDIVILDPPRSGVDKVLLETIADVGPEKVIYVSCDPATLARDVKILGEMGYRTEEVTPVDMFPHTMHVECVSLLPRIKTSDKVEVKMDIEDGEVTP